MNLNIKPSKVTVKIDAQRIYPELKNLEIIPTSEEQHYTGSFGDVRVKGVITENLNIIPSTEKQNFKGIYGEVNVEAIEAKELVLIPSTTEQIVKGVYTSVTITGDSNLLAENIRKGVSIFNVEGEFEGVHEEKEFNALIETNTQFTLANGITKIEDLDLTSATSMQNAFQNCGKLKSIKSISNTQNVTNMTGVFYGCASLIEIPSMNTSNVTNMQNIFYGCSKITTIPQLDTANVTNMNQMFGSCVSLVTIPQIEAGKSINMSSILTGCRSLVNFGGFLNVGKAYTQKTKNYSNYTINLTGCTNITYESLMNIVNGLYDLNLTYNVTGGGTLYTQQLQMGVNIKSKLTAEEIAIATSKGWTVS